MKRWAARVRSRALALRISPVLLSAVLMLPRAHTAWAAGVVGTSTADSCTDAAFDAALAGGGLVTFDCGPAPVTIDISPGAGGTGTKAIAADTTVDGGSLITISGGHSVAVFSVNAGITFTVENLTVAAGSMHTAGGGIHSNGGKLTVINSTFSGNSAGGAGGIYSINGTVTVTNSTFSGNRATAYGVAGGGIASVSGTLTVINSTFSGNSTNLAAGGGIYSDTNKLTAMSSTFSGNSASYGGGIYSYGGTLTVAGSTFAGNIASGTGGGIISYDPLAVTNCTFAGNSASYGGGIENHGTLTIMNSTFSDNSASTLGGGIFTDGRLTITNTILANSTVGGNCAGGAITDGGHNIDDGTTCAFTGTDCTSTTGSSFCRTSPQLDMAGLANHGGPTATIALEAGSPAINAGDETICAAPPVSDLDQRGYGRPGNGATACSIGAYEYNAVPAAPTPTPCIGNCTPPSPSPTPTITGANFCAGDCDGGGDVTVDEIITLVNIDLGTADATVCTNGIPGGVSVDITLIIQAVGNALTQCPAP